MTITVEKYPNDPIIVATMKEPMDFYQQIPDMFARILELRDNLQGYKKYYVIINMTGIKADFSEIVFSLGEARKTSQKRRPDMAISLHLVGAGDLFEMVANALSQIQYGGYTAPLHASSEEALKAIRSEMEKAI
jgi:hypothetical protein